MSKPQRRKGNAKTASSAAAHMYLGESSMMGLMPEMNIFETSESRAEIVSDVDNETRIILRKLVKKDPQTREKGLRELLALVEVAEAESLEPCYEYFASIVDKSATDGSATVRLLTIKLAGTLIAKLKKSASKGLKKIMPFVLFALCDVSNSVCNAAENVLRTNFEGEKRAQAINIFSPSAVEVAVQVIEGSHELCRPAKYDDEEDEQQRRLRLESNSLSFLHFVASNTSHNSWVPGVQSLFDNKTLLKTILCGSKPYLKTGLVSLSVLLPNAADVILDTYICSWSMSSLDSSEETVCAIAWRAFSMLVEHPRFFEKCSVEKMVVPRLLKVVRTKSDHWKRMGPYVLPCVAMISTAAASGSEKVVCSVLESFVDNMPFDATCQPPSVREWAKATSEVVKWTLGRVTQEAENTKKVAMRTIVRLCETVSACEMQDVHVIFSELVAWILDKDALCESDLQELLQLVTFNLINQKEKNDGFLEKLLELGRHVELCPLHAMLLSKPDDVPVFAVRALLNATNTYFVAVLERIERCSFLLPTSKWSTKEDVSAAVTVFERVVNLGLAHKAPIKAENNSFCRELLILSVKNDLVWSSVFEKSSEIISDMIGTWQNDQDGEAVGKIIDLLKEKGISVNIEEGPTSERFIVQLLKTSKTMTLERRQFFSDKLFDLFFASSDVSNDANEVCAMIASNRPSETLCRGYFYNLLSEPRDVTSINDLSRRLNMVLSHCEDEQTRLNLRNGVLADGRHIDQVVDHFGFMNVDVMFSTQYDLIVPCQSTSSNDTATWEDLQKKLDNMTQFAYFCLVSAEDHEDSHGYAAVVSTLVGLWSQRYAYVETTEHEKTMLLDLKERLNKIRVSNVLSLHANKSPLILESIVSYLPPSNSHHKLLENMTGSVSTTTLVSMGLNPTVKQISTGLKWVSRYRVESKENFVQQLKSVVEDGSGDEVEMNLFLASAPGDAWTLNILVLRVLISVADDVFDIDDSSVTDFLLCGLVALFDSINDMFNGDVLKLSDDAHVLASQCLDVFSKVAGAARRSGEMANEWNVFFMPTITRIVFKWIAQLPKDSRPTPFVRSLLSAVKEIHELPSDLQDIQSTEQSVFLPCLDAFQYSPAEQALIVVAFSMLDSSVVDVQLIGLHVAKLLMPFMFEKENKKALENETTSSEKVDTTIRLPTMLLTCRDQMTSSFSRVLLLDLALVPLSTTLSEESDDRVAYFQALIPIVQVGMPPLISLAPEQIPKSLERDYFRTEYDTPSAVFIDRYIAHLLFRVLSVMPAVVRFWYKSLPTAAATIVQKYVTKCASRLLIEGELEKVENAKSKLTDSELKIRVIPMASEVIAEYTVDETKMRLSICMSADWPLGMPKIELDKAVVKNDKSKWMLCQLATFLNHQNGSILEGVTRWRKNVDRGVEGAEACTICMMTIHVKSHQLPQKKCQQCKNKFHTNCLYKWFETSNQSNCPLCRANFT